MLKSAIQPGTEYAFREKRAVGAPFQHVRILEHIRKNKWKAKWIDPNPGLVDYVESSQLIVPWKERRAFLKEEESAERLHNHNSRLGYKEQSPVANAMYEIYESVGDEVSFYRGTLTCSPEALNRLKTRAKVASGDNSTIAYADRQGRLHLPFDEALELGRKFCAAEPATILAGVEATERKWAQEARQPGEEHMVGLLNEYRAAWALVRQWAGHEAAVAQREEQIQKLERLVWDAVYALQKAGLDNEAARLRRAIQKH
jgi:hypothetical protein